MRVNKIIKGENMNKPKLYIMCGISASGKSTIAKQIAERDNCVIVSSDAIRGEICEGGVSDQSKNEEVFQIFHRRIREFLLNGNNVIADATNITIKSRKAIFNTVRDIDCEKIGYIVPKKYEYCLEHNNNINRVAVPDYVITKQVHKFQIPFYEEGFDKIIIHDFEYDTIPMFVPNLLKRMRKFDQKNPYHNSTLGAHCADTSILLNELNDYKYTVYPYAAIFHDVGKLMTQTFDKNGIAHYYSHENIGCYYLLSNIKSFRIYRNLTDDEILDILFLINYHMFPINWNTDKAKEKWRNIFGDYRYQLLVDFNKCDKMRPDDKNKLSEL